MEEQKGRKQKQERQRSKVAGLLFILALSVFLIVNIVKSDREFSDSENRVLAQKPEFTLSRVANGRFMEDYEDYKSDQFVGRNFWVSLKTKISYFAGERESKGVYNGKNHYLMEEIKMPDNKAMRANLEAINAFQEEYEDIPIYMCLVPNAANVLSDKLPLFAVTENQDKQMKEIQKKLDGKIHWVDMKKPLQEHKDEDIYYRTDHHWTTLGAYYGFQALAKEAGISDKTAKKMKPYAVTTSFNGTLSSTSGYELGYEEPIYIYYSDQMPEAVLLYVQQQEKRASWYDSSKLGEKDKYAMFLGGNYPLIDISTTSDAKKRILIVKDSYANCFIPFLASEYQEIVVVDPRYYYGSVKELVKNYGIDEVLFLYNTNTFVEDKNISAVLE